MAQVTEHKQQTTKVYQGYKVTITNNMYGFDDVVYYKHLDNAKHCIDTNMSVGVTITLYGEVDINTYDIIEVFDGCIKYENDNIAATRYDDEQELAIAIEEFYNGQIQQGTGYEAYYSKVVDTTPTPKEMHTIQISTNHYDYIALGLYHARPKDVTLDSLILSAYLVGIQELLFAFHHDPTFDEGHFLDTAGLYRSENRALALLPF